MAKKKKRAGKSAIRKVGKITFLYFSGDVGEFIEALSAKLKDPKTMTELSKAIEVSMAGVAAAQQADEASKSRSKRGRFDGEPS